VDQAVVGSAHAAPPRRPGLDNLIGEGRLVRPLDSYLQWGSVMAAMIAQALCRRDDAIPGAHGAAFFIHPETDEIKHAMLGTETTISFEQSKKNTEMLP
jgi:hypothetical protein